MKIREGWLEKRQLRLPMYQKRYFVLTQEYFMYEGKTAQEEDSTSHSKRGKASFALISLRDARAIDCSNFMLDFFSRQFHLRTPEGNASSWVADIKNAARECGGLAKYCYGTKGLGSKLTFAKFAQEDSDTALISSHIRGLERYCAT